MSARPLSSPSHAAIDAIRPCVESDFSQILETINDGARAYRGHIPEDFWKEPYVSPAELHDALDQGMRFLAVVEPSGRFAGVLAMHERKNACMIRYVYVRCAVQGQGVGTRLLHACQSIATKKILIAAWRGATWAVAFYERHGFRKISSPLKGALHTHYWKMSGALTEASVILVQPGMDDAYAWAMIEQSQDD
jgi:N-acetylglutamate synthase-like GNAT family acetyltransferase